MNHRRRRVPNDCALDNLIGKTPKRYIQILKTENVYTMIT
jgi:hypothetical protein